MKDKKIKKIVTFVISTFGLFFSSSVLATVSYIPLESIPGTNFSSTNPVTFENLSMFFGQVFNYGLAVTAVLALIMVIAGGIQYMTTDSWMGKEDGRKRIEEALIGLGIALISWLILYTINPCLVYYTATNGCNSANTLITPSTTKL
jgi:hypothetical protein